MFLSNKVRADSGFYSVVKKIFFPTIYFPLIRKSEASQPQLLMPVILAIQDVEIKRTQGQPQANSDTSSQLIKRWVGWYMPAFPGRQEV